MFFESFESLQRTAIVGISAYVLLVFFLRISGRRTLSKMNAFDFVVTVALGSILATVLLNKNVSLADGALAFALLIGLQFVVTWSSVRMSWVKKTVTGEPIMLIYQGQLLPEALLRARVTENELHAAVRGDGVLDVHQVEAVVLETDGSFSVVKKGSSGSGNWALKDVKVPTVKHPGEGSQDRPNP